MSRRPRGICPVCRNTMSLTWSGEVRVLRKHAADAEPCSGSGRPAVGEVTEISLARAPRAERSPAASPAGAGATAGTLNRSSAA